MSFAGAKAIVTGGLGLIGSNLARRLLAEGAAVTVVDSLEPRFGGNRANISDIEDRLDVRVADIRDRGMWPSLVDGADFLFNLAAQTSHVDSMREPFEDLEINAAAQLGIVEACRQFAPAARLVFTSTRQIYGRPQYLPVDERHPINPPDVNGVNKLAGEGFHLLYHQVYGLTASVLRLTNTFGPGMRVKDARQTFIGMWIRNLLEGKPILVFGDGRQVRDLNYVDDCVEALLLAAIRPEAHGRVFNLGGDPPMSLLELANAMVEINGRGTVEVVPFPAERKAIDIGDFYGDYSAFTAATGWVPRVPLAEALRRSIDYYRTRLAAYI